MRAGGRAAGGYPRRLLAGRVCYILFRTSTGPGRAHDDIPLSVRIAPAFSGGRDQVQLHAPGTGQVRLEKFSMGCVPS